MPEPDVLPSTSAASASSAAAAIDDAVTHFAGYLTQARRYSPHTVRCYSSDVRALLTYAAATGVEVTAERGIAIDLNLLRAWLAQGVAAGAARSTLARRAASARTFTAWAHRRGLLAGPADPGVRLMPPKRHRHLPSVPGTSAVVAMLEAAAANDHDEVMRLRDVAMLEVLYGSGLRVAELCGLNLADLRVDDGLVRVVGKGDVQRSVPLGEPAWQAVDRWLTEGRGQWANLTSGDAVFLGRRGKRIDQRVVRRVVQTTSLQATGRGLSPHALRHAMATDVLEGGMDVRSVQEMLGHRSLSSTGIYAHVTTDRLRKVYARAHPRA